MAKAKRDSPRRAGWDENLCTECKSRAERRERSCTKIHEPTKALRGDEPEKVASTKAPVPRKSMVGRGFSDFPITREALYAYDILVERARSRREITYKELYLAMREEFGWPEWTPGHVWFKKLPLPGVAQACRERNEPCLSALVRKQDGTIGKGYQTAHGVRYRKELTSHDYSCECDNCETLIASAVRVESEAAFAHWRGRHG